MLWQYSPSCPRATSGIELPHTHVKARPLLPKPPVSGHSAAPSQRRRPSFAALVDVRSALMQEASYATTVRARGYMTKLSIRRLWTRYAVCGL